MHAAAKPFDQRRLARSDRSANANLERFWNHDLNSRASSCAWRIEAISSAGANPAISSTAFCDRVGRRACQSVAKASDDELSCSCPNGIKRSAAPTIAAVENTDTRRRFHAAAILRAAGNPEHHRSDGTASYPRLRAAQTSRAIGCSIRASAILRGLPSHLAAGVAQLLRWLHRVEQSESNSTHAVEIFRRQPRARAFTIATRHRSVPRCLPDKPADSCSTPSASGHDRRASHTFRARTNVHTRPREKPVAELQQA